MSGEEMTDEELFNLFEAARWGPSNYNNQPWRFVYAKRNHPKFNTFANILKPGNKKWATDASVLIILVTDMYNRYKGNKTFLITNSFASGTAFMAMALETSARGYVVHSMAGFDRELAAQELKIENNTEYRVEVMIAIGKRVAPEKRTPGFEKMSLRDPIQNFISEGVFSPKWL
jgi:nitroreductase